MKKQEPLERLGGLGAQDGFDPLDGFAGTEGLPAEASASRDSWESGGSAWGSPGEDSGREDPSATGLTGASFWNGHPPDRRKLAYTEPPLRPEAEEAFRGLKEGIAAQYPLRADALEWGLVTGPLAAAQEQEALLREAGERRTARQRGAEAERQGLDEGLTKLREREREAAAALAGAREACAEALAAANLAAPEGDPTPADVEEALQEAAPTLEELAGEHGVPPPVGEAPWSPFGFLACLASGSLLALCLGTLVGLLSLTDLQRGDRLPALALAALVGGVTVASLGGLVGQAAGSLAEALRPPGPERLRPAGSLPVALLLGAAALLLLAAEVGAEAIGMRELHQESLQAALRTGGGGSGAALLPPWAYLLVGTLVSGPYVAHWAAKSWAERLARMQEAWLLREQRRWLEGRRAEPEVRRAFALAAALEGRAAALASLEEAREALEGRRDALLDDGLDPETQAVLDHARAAGVGLSAEFRETLSGLVDELEPLPKKRQGFRLWG